MKSTNRYSSFVIAFIAATTAALAGCAGDESTTDLESSLESASLPCQKAEKPPTAPQVSGEQSGEGSEQRREITEEGGEQGGALRGVAGEQGAHDCADLGQSGEAPEGVKRRNP